MRGGADPPGGSDREGLPIRARIRSERWRDVPRAIKVGVRRRSEAVLWRQPGAADLTMPPRSIAFEAGVRIIEIDHRAF